MPSCGPHAPSPTHYPKTVELIPGKQALDGSSSWKPMQNPTFRGGTICDAPKYNAPLIRTDMALRKGDST